MAHDIFISYSHMDKAVADAICANLEKERIRCWVAPRDIAPGLDWPTAIAEAIAASRVMVLVFSRHSNSSQDVSRELILAANSGLIIIPFKIDDTLPQPGKQYYLARTHWLDAMNPPTQEQINTLVGYVSLFVSGKRATGKKKPRPAPTPVAAEIHPPAVAPRAVTVEAEIPPSVMEPVTPPVKAMPAGQKWAGKRTTSWIWGALLLLVLAGGGGLTARFLLPGANPSPTETRTISSTSTRIPTITPVPTVTSTPIPAWITGFSEPILAVIKNYPTDFVDDLSQPLSGWTVEDGTIQINDGALVVRQKSPVDVSMYTSFNNRGMFFNNFVLQFDANLIDLRGCMQGDKRDQLTIHWRSGMAVQIWRCEERVTSQIAICGDMGCTIDMEKIMVLNIDQPVQVTIISLGTKIAVYLKSYPILYSSSAVIAGDSENSLDIWTSLNTAAVIRLDNFKTWNLDKIPNLPP
jgi:hypothetical protein